LIKHDIEQNYTSDTYMVHPLQLILRETLLTALTEMSYTYG